MTLQGCFAHPKKWTREYGVEEKHSESGQTCLCGQIYLSGNAVHLAVHFIKLMDQCLTIQALMMAHFVTVDLPLSCIHVRMKSFLSKLNSMDNFDIFR